MESALHRPRATFLVVAVFCFLAFAKTANAATILVELYVDLHSLVQADGVTPLADGSLIQIIQSTDAIADGFGMHGDCYVINSTAGNDVILAETTVGSQALPDSGLFYWSAELDIDVNSTYFYIRFFDYAASNILLLGNCSNLYWGTSSVYLAGNYDSNLYVSIDIAASTNLAANMQDHFVVIPEPSSVSFFALVGGLALAMKARLKRRIQSGQESTTKDDAA